MTLGEYIAAQVREAIDGAIRDSEGTLKAVAEAGGSKAGDGLFGDVTSIVDAIVGAISVLPIISDVIDLPLAPVKAVESAGGKLAGGFGAGYLLGYLMQPLMQPLLLPLQHLVNAHTTNEIFDPNTAAQLVAKGIIAQEFAFSEASGNGLDDQHEGSLIEAARSYPAITETLMMLNRGLITQDEAVLILTRNGVTPAYIDKLIQLRNIVLAPADVALAILRGNITQDDGYAIAAQSGVSQADMDVLIGNTGEPPGLMQLLEAYRRGFIDKSTLQHGIRQSRVRDEWIPVVEQLRYAPMSVADAVRAVVENYMTPEEGAAIAQQNGLEPDHWQYLYESYGRPIAVGEALQLMHRGQMTVDEVKQAVRESDVKDKYIDKVVELGRRLVPERQIVTMIDHGVITRDQGISMLKEWGYTDTDASRLVNLGIAQHVGSHHTLSKTDTLAMYSDGLINKEQAVKYLEALGYTAELAGQMIALANYKQKAALTKLTMRGIEAEIKTGQITADKARQALVTAGLDAEQARAYVAEWEQTKRTVSRTLTEAQTLKAVKDGVISLDDGRTRLQAMGLSVTDIDILFKVEGFVPYTPLKLPGA